MAAQGTTEAGRDSARTRRLVVRVAVAAALAAAAIGTLVAGNAVAPTAPPTRPFEVKGWEYGRILPPGAPARYRLRVDVAGSYVPARRSGPASSEFRFLLERRDDAHFTCLRWVDGDLELVGVEAGKPAKLIGRTSYPLPCIARPEGAYGEGEPETFVVDRSPGLWIVTFLGREVIVAGDPRAPGGPEESDFAWGATPGWTLAARALQPVEDIHLEDGFARVKFNEDGTYDIRSGVWELDSVRDVQRSVNAFRLVGRSAPGAGGGAAPALALFGRSFWRGYRAEAAVKFVYPGAGGLVFAAQRLAPPRGPTTRVDLVEEGAGDAADAGRADRTALPLARYGLLRWRHPARDEARPGALEVVDVRVRRAGGAERRDERTILSLPWTPRTGQWHQVSVSLFGGTGEVEVNGARAAFRLPPGLGSGECGLFADSVKGVLFDDIRVASHDAFLHRPGACPRPWTEGRKDGCKVYRLPGGPSWLRMGMDAGAVPVAVGWRDSAGGAVSVELDPAKGRGEARRQAPGAGGGQERLAEFEVAFPGPYALEIGRDGCRILRGLTALADFALDAEREGPVVVRSPGALAELAGGPLPPSPALRHKTTSFADVDVTTHGGGKHPEFKWIGFVGWMKDASSWTKGPDGLLSCETLLWGRVEASVQVPLPEKDGDEALLRLAPDGRDAGAAGVGLRRGPGGLMITDAGGSDRGTFDPGPAETAAGKVALSLRRAGGRVEARVAGERAFAALLDADLPVRVEARAAALDTEAIEVRASSVDESLFESAPVEWVRWRGHWNVTTKWQCDPRWTFLGVWSDGLEKKSDAAGVFTRASYLGDQDLRFYFAFRDVLNNCHGDNRRYVRRDMNFAFACEGEDLASGYNLLIGGYDNRGTQLLRRGELVHETDGFKWPVFRNDHSDIHWRWFCLRITRRAGRISATVNGEEILAWTDLDPLAGGHVGVWTLGGGIILGRTRFSAERRGDEMAGFSTSPPPAPVGSWWPVDEDHAVRLAPAEGEDSVGGADRRAVLVANVSAGGHLGVACDPGGNGQARAVVFRARPGVRVRAYAVAAAALKHGFPLGLERTPRKILPSDEEPLPADGEWHVLAADGALSAGEALVVGNWESDGYAAAGIGANGIRASYEAGAFASVGEAEDFVRRVEEGAIVRAMPPNLCRADAVAHAGGAGRIGVAGGWEVLDWGNPAKMSVHRRAGGGETLLLRCSAGKHDKTVVRREIALSLATGGAFRVDVYNANTREVPVAFAVWSGADYVYSESRFRPCLPGRWNHLEFDLAARDFKSADSCWKHTSALRGPGAVREVALLFYTNASGGLAVENIDVDIDGEPLRPRRPAQEELPPREEAVPPGTAGSQTPPEKPKAEPEAEGKPEVEPAPAPKVEPTPAPKVEPEKKPEEPPQERAPARPRRPEDPGGPF